MRDVKKLFAVISIILFCFLLSQGLSSETRGVENGQRYDRLVIRNVIVIDLPEVSDNKIYVKNLWVHSHFLTITIGHDQNAHYHP